MITLQPVLVTDTNIWIDLENGDILVDVFKLPYRFLTSELAIPEFTRPSWQTLQTLGLEACELAADQVAELLRLRLIHKGLSITDLAAFTLAKTLNVTLLTGDRRLSELAAANDLPVHGILWLLDEIVHFQALTPMRAAGALQCMLNQGARLPPDECCRRLASWSM